MIKQIAKNIITFLLKWEAKMILRRYKPKIIALTGTVGKTSAKDAVATVLSSDFFTRKSVKSYNSELGVPLTIIGAKSAWNSLLGWCRILFKGLRLLIAKYDYPELLVLELGVDRPGDMGRLMEWIKPDVGVITRLGEVPAHIEYFKSIEDVAKEKAKLLQALKEGDYAILNGDDRLILDLVGKTKGNVLTYGFANDANTSGTDLKASNYHIVYRKEDNRDIPEGVTFKVDYEGIIAPIRLYGVFGRQAVYNALSALAVGSTLGLNMIEMAESLSLYKSPPGRLKLLKGIKHTFIIDDTYNSSPLAAEMALEVLADIPAKRKVIVWGDMLELGKYTIDEHKKIGKIIKGRVDLLFTVGPRSKFLAEEARLSGFDKDNIFEFSTANEAKKEIQKRIVEDDLILVKGSQGMRMERVVEEIMADPENKEELLVRQEKEWQTK